jgi:heme/copper-type cytochrome/quinol oxidase subunit 3
MSAEAAAAHDHDHHHAELHPDQWPVDVAVAKASMAKVGMWIFLLSDALMFAGFLLAYGILRGGADQWHSPGEPELGINFTAGLTFLLICSSVSYVFAYAAALEKDKKGVLKWLGLTICGGLLFLCGQYDEYFGLIFSHGLTNEGLLWGQSAYASTFYLITSFHGAHVFSGVTLMTILWIRTKMGKYDDGNYDHIEAVGLFWHFVDLVWILVFTFIYLIPDKSAHG